MPKQISAQRAKDIQQAVLEANSGGVMQDDTQVRDAYQGLGLTTYVIPGDGMCWYNSTAAGMGLALPAAEIDQLYKTFGLDAIRDQQNFPLGRFLHSLALGGRLLAGEKFDVATETQNKDERYANLRSQAMVGTIFGVDLVTYEYKRPGFDEYGYQVLQHQMAQFDPTLAATVDRDQFVTPAQPPKMESVIPSVGARRVDPIVLQSNITTHHTSMLAGSVPENFQVKIEAVQQNPAAAILKVQLNVEHLQQTAECIAERGRAQFYVDAWNAFHKQAQHLDLNEPSEQATADLLARLGHVDVPQVEGPVAAAAELEGGGGEGAPLPSAQLEDDAKLAAELAAQFAREDAQVAADAAMARRMVEGSDAAATPDAGKQQSRDHNNALVPAQPKRIQRTPEQIEEARAKAKAKRDALKERWRAEAQAKQKRAAAQRTAAKSAAAGNQEAQQQDAAPSQEAAAIVAPLREAQQQQRAAAADASGSGGAALSLAENTPINHWVQNLAAYITNSHYEKIHKKSGRFRFKAFAKGPERMTIHKITGAVALLMVVFKSTEAGQEVKAGNHEAFLSGFTSFLQNAGAKIPDNVMERCQRFHTGQLISRISSENYDSVFELGIAGPGGRKAALAQVFKTGKSLKDLANAAPEGAIPDKARVVIGLRPETPDADLGAAAGSDGSRPGATG